jgi:hypothetical protein
MAGTRGDGVITLVLGIAAALFLAVWQVRKWSLVNAATALVVALGVAGYDTIHIEHDLHRATVFGHQVAAAGWGVYAVVAGAAVALASSAALAIPASVERFAVIALPIVAGLAVFDVGAAIETHSATKQATSASAATPAVSSGSCSAGGIAQVVGAISFINGTCDAARDAVRKIESGNETWSFVGRLQARIQSGMLSVNATSVKGGQCVVDQINQVSVRYFWSCAGNGSSVS